MADSQSLTKKVTLAFGGFSLTLALIAFAVLHSTISPAFAKLERQFADSDLLLVSRGIEAELRTLHTTNLEYSLWDDTYEYLLGNNPEFIEENFEADYFESVNLNLAIIMDTSGNIAWSELNKNGNKLSLQEQLLEKIDTDHPFFRVKASDQGINGFWVLKNGVMMITAEPIHRLDRESTATGTFVAGRYLDQKLVDALHKATEVDLTLFPVAQSLQPLLHRARGDFDNLSNNIYQISDLMSVNTGLATALKERHPDPLAVSYGEHSPKELEWQSNAVNIRQYLSLFDIFQQPVALLQASTPRSITELGKISINYSLSALAISLLLIFMMLFRYMRKLIIRPLLKIHDHIQEIARSGNLEAKIAAHRNDEIGTLADAFDDMTTVVSATQHSLEEKSEQLRLSAKAKDQFLATMSHELRTPLNAILGFSELGKLHDNCDEELKDFFSTIHSSGENLLLLVNDVLDFSKMDDGSLMPDYEPYQLRKLIDDVEAITRTDKPIAIRYKVDPRLPQEMIGDIARTRQILLNLVSNAIKFTDEGIIEIDVTLLGEFVQFRVTDTGIGLTDEQLGQLFTRFWQADSTSSRKYGGTGLGLSISKGLTELMGGELKASSPGPDQGSVFILRLPLDPR